jgi:hypothetical protein
VQGSRRDAFHDNIDLEQHRLRSRRAPDAERAIPRLGRRAADRSCCGRADDLRS